MHELAASRGDGGEGHRPGGMTRFMSDRLSLVGKIVFGICLTLGKWACVHVFCARVCASGPA